MSDDRYDIENARHRIDGYYFPTPMEEQTQAGRIAAFSRAKAECLKHMQASIDFTATMTPEMQWPKMVREGGAA